MTTVRALCIKVPRGEAEFTRKKLLEQNLLDIGLRIRRQGDVVLFPVRSEKAAELGFELVEEDLEEREVMVTDYRLVAKLPDEVRALLPTSFDIIGDVAIIRLGDDLVEHASEIGKALMTTFPRLRTIALDRGVKGELRVRELQVIAGDPDAETVHVEHGIRLRVDPTKVYFNPRLANERRRIASLVRAGERVVDMFSGVGPFAIMIAKHSRPEAIWAMDLNHDAVEYMRRNIQLNKVTTVIPLEGDSADLLFRVPCADRIIMNLPHSARDFFADALTRLNMGGVIHLYVICERDEISDVAIGLATEARGMGVRVGMERIEELKTYSPTMSVFALDIRFLDWC
ncbi:MAG: class I SAM-dependent methyltransferase family protein [Euryarchaeota archaeon]|nr:class I SAM-dependent methyltransferase family protein [Euryarchaeota archaeon]